MRRRASSSVMRVACSLPGGKILRVNIWTKIGQLLGRVVPIRRGAASTRNDSQVVLGTLGRKRRLKIFLRGAALGVDLTRVFGRPVSIFARPLPRRSVWEAAGDDLRNAIKSFDRDQRSKKTPGA
jgi:hypothetical protein